MTAMTHRPARRHNPPCGRTAQAVQRSGRWDRAPSEVRMRRTGRAIAVAGSLALLATGCLGSNNDSGDANRNAQASTVTLSIAANAAPGGKNAQEADWITKWVIPKFVEAQRAKGVNATVTFQPSGVGDEDYKS